MAIGGGRCGSNLCATYKYFVTRDCRVVGGCGPREINLRCRDCGARESGGSSGDLCVGDDGRVSDSDRVGAGILCRVSARHRDSVGT